MAVIVRDDINPAHCCDLRNSSQPTSLNRGAGRRRTVRPGANGRVRRPRGSCGDRNTPSPEMLLMRFSYRTVPEVYQLFWAAMARSELITDAAVEAGTYRKQAPGGWSRRVGFGRTVADSSRCRAPAPAGSVETATLLACR
jgi:hypothetical protein